MVWECPVFFCRRAWRLAPCWGVYYSSYSKINGGFSQAQLLNPLVPHYLRLLLRPLPTSTPLSHPPSLDLPSPPPLLCHIQGTRFVRPIPEHITRLHTLFSVWRADLEQTLQQRLTDRFAEMERQFLARVLTPGPPTTSSREIRTSNNHRSDSFPESTKNDCVF